MEVIVLDVAASGLPELVKKLVAAGMDVTSQPAQPFLETIKGESASYAAIFKRLNIKAE